jgi:phospholipid/cholesterol/gamma-HCH transport system permease protein
MKRSVEIPNFVSIRAQDLAGICLVLVESFLAAPAILRGTAKQVFMRQVYFTGIEALPLLAAAAFLAGYLTVFQLFSVLANDLDLTLTVFRSLVVQEGAVLLVSMFVLARSGSAMASEIANMKLNGELDSIWRLGLDVSQIILAPRVLSCALSVAALTVYVQLILVFGGIGLMSLFHRWDYPLAIEKYLGGVQPAVALMTLFRSLLFGAAISAVACSKGLRARPGPTGIPNATRGAVVGGFAAIFVLQAIFSLI